MKARNKERKKLSATAFYIIALIILTVFLTVPFIATAYIVRYFSEEVFYEQQKSELLSYARILNTRLGPDGYEGILADAGKSGAEVTKEEKIKVLNEALTPDTDQIASASAGLGIGFYSRELDAILTYGPSADFLQTIGTPIGETHPGRTVMAADKEMVVIGTMVRGNIMNAMVPVVRHGEVIGYIWANQLVSALETALQNTANVIFSILVTAYVIILAVIVAFFLMIIRSEKKARAAVEASAEKALVATKAKSSFLASMSHEIRTPINAVIGMTTIGKTTADMEKAVRCFEKIEDASKHLLGVINDILDMSKIEAGKMEISLVSFEFEAMIRRVINVSAFRIDEKRQSFAVHIDKNIPRALIGDDQRLAQVITNLLSNAVKFTPEQGSISLDAEFAGESEGICTILIKVTDSGIGISPEQQSRLFGVFQQANSGTTRKFGGTGLGLAISQNIVEMMGGHISIKSELDKGSEFSFTVRLPRDEEAGVNAVEAATKTENKDLTGRRILLADDIEINREIVITLLEPFGIECDCAGDGTEAVRLFTESPDRYDLILMDMQMPEMDGCEATQHIRALAFPSAKTVPIVAMTANVFREDIDKCIKAGMNDHLAKPIDAATLVEKISRYTSPR